MSKPIILQNIETALNRAVPYLGLATVAGQANSFNIAFTELLATGQCFTVKLPSNADAPAYLGITGLYGGAFKKVLKPDGTDATLKTGIAQFMWDGTNFILLGKGGEYGNVTAADVRSGVTFGTDTGLQTGTSTAKKWAKVNFTKTWQTSETQIITFGALGFTPTKVFIVSDGTLTNGLSWVDGVMTRAGTNAVATFSTTQVSVPNNTSAHTETGALYIFE